MGFFSLKDTCVICGQEAVLGEKCKTKIGMICKPCADKLALQGVSIFAVKKYDMKQLKIFCGVKETIDYKSIPPEKIICLDVETTGLDPEKDEILQLSIIAGNGETLFNEYIKPRKRKAWHDAQKIHGISPEAVKDKPTIDAHLKRVSELLADAELIVGYNVLYFDLPFLEAAGVDVPDDDNVYDVMLEFAPVYGEWSDYHDDYKWQKLITCARYYRYKPTGDFHDSLEDVRATLYCYYEMINKI